MRALLVKHNLASNVEVMYCVNFARRTLHPFLVIPPETEQDRQLPLLRFWAYPVSATKIRYAFHQPPKKVRSDTLMYYITPEEDIPPPEPDTANRKLSVHVELSGLTLALKLGICSRKEMEQTVAVFAQWVGGLWITYDDQKHPRHISFVSCHENNLSVSTKNCNAAGEDDTAMWTKLLEHVQSCGHIARTEKENVLRPILDRLEPYHRLNRRDAWCKCYDSLIAAVNKYKVFVYGSDDTALHTLKVPIAGVFKRKGSRGVTMHMLANNNIAALSTRNIDFVNLNEYLSHEGGAFDPWQDDVDLWKVVQDWSSGDPSEDKSTWASPCLKHSRQLLRGYPKVSPNKTFSRYLNERGCRNADALRSLGPPRDISGLQLWL